MALDRFVYFGSKRKPKKDEIESVLRNFFGEDAAKIEWSETRWLILLPGKGTFPYEGIVDEHGPVKDHIKERRERWIEVYPGNPLDVITRMQDEYTNVLAAGLAEVFARFWEGKIDV